MSRLHYYKRKDFEVDYTDEELSDYDVGMETPPIPDDAMSEDLSSDYYNALLSTGSTPSHSSDESWWEDEVHSKRQFNRNDNAPTPDLPPEENEEVDVIIITGENKTFNVNAQSNINFLPVFMAQHNASISNVEVNLDQTSLEYRISKPDDPLGLQPPGTNQEWIDWQSTRKVGATYFLVPILLNDVNQTNRISMTISVDFISNNYPCEHNYLEYYPIHATYKDVFTNQNAEFPANTRQEYSYDQDLQTLPYKTASQGQNVELHWDIKRGADEALDSYLYEGQKNHGIHLIKVGYYWRIQAQYANLTMISATTYLPTTAFLYTERAEDMSWNDVTANQGKQKVFDQDGNLVFGFAPPQFVQSNGQIWNHQDPILIDYDIPHPQTADLPYFVKHPPIYTISGQCNLQWRKLAYMYPTQYRTLWEGEKYDEYQQLTTTCLYHTNPYPAIMDILPEYAMRNTTINTLYGELLCGIGYNRNYDDGVYNELQLPYPDQYGKLYHRQWVSYYPSDHYTVQQEVTTFAPHGHYYNFSDFAGADFLLAENQVTPPLKYSTLPREITLNSVCLLGAQADSDNLQQVRIYTGVGTPRFDQPSSITLVNDMITTQKDVEITVPFLVNTHTRQSHNVIQIGIKIDNLTQGENVNVQLGYKNPGFLSTFPQKPCQQGDIVLLTTSFYGTGTQPENLLQNYASGMQYIDLTIRFFNVTNQVNSIIFNIHYMNTQLPTTHRFEEILLQPNDFIPAITQQSNYPQIMQNIIPYNVRQTHEPLDEYEPTGFIINGLGTINYLEGNVPVAIPLRLHLYTATELEALAQLQQLPFLPLMGSLYTRLHLNNDQDYSSNLIINEPSFNSIVTLLYAHDEKEVFPPYQAVLNALGDWLPQMIV